MAVVGNERSTLELSMARVRTRARVTQYDLPGNSERDRGHGI